MPKTIRKGIELDDSILTIDELTLDRECMRQPKLFMSAALKSADARAEMEELKSAMDLKRAEVDAAIRANPEKYDIEKVTEGAISKAIELDEEFIEAKEAYARSRYELDVHQAMVNALEHKRSMLGHLVSLHGQNYFSDVRPESKKGREALEESRADAAARRTRTIGSRR